MDSEYKSPILTTIFQILGTFILIASVFVAIVLALDRDRIGMLPAAGIAIGGLLSATIYFGIAQVVDFLGRTAHNTKRLRSIVETSIVSQIQAVEKRLSSAAPILVRMDKVSSAPPSGSTRAGCNYHYAIDGNQEGPFSAADLKGLRSAGVIADDTPVFKEGDSQWRTFLEHPDLVLR